MAAASSILIGAAVVSAASAVAGGIEANKAAKEKAKLLNSETQEAVNLKEAQIDDTLGAQKVALASSGVEVESDLGILEETRLQGLREIEAIKRQGSAQASQVLSQGRSALIGSVTGAVSGLAQGYAGAQSLNAQNFNAAKKGTV